MSYPPFVVLSNEDILVETATKKMPLGTRGIMGDGRVFKYSKAGMALTVGTPCVSFIQGAVSNQTINMTEGPTTTFSQIHFTNSAAMTDSAAADEFADGYLMVRTGVGSGQMLHIGGNSTFGSTGAGDFYVYLKGDSRLQTAISSTAVCFIYRNPYWGVRPAKSSTAFKAPATTDTGLWLTTTNFGAPMGIPPVGITSGYYFWLQTWGPCVVLCEPTTWVRGENLYLSTTTSTGTVLYGLTVQATSSGNITGFAIERFPCWGYALSAPATTVSGLMFLTLSP